MNRDEIEDLQRAVGAVVDGYWGPKSNRATQEYLLALMPKDNPWPESNEESLRQFYGNPGDTSKIVGIEAPYWLRLYGEADEPVEKIYCHEKVAASLSRALSSAYEIDPYVASSFFGCYVNRPMRGGSRPSLHAYGAAIDLDANRNRFRWHWPVTAKMPLGVMAAFALEGWTPAGAFWNYDAMHFQATRP